MYLADCYDEMVRGLCGISYEDWLITKDTIPSLVTSEGLPPPIQIHARSTSEEIAFSANAAPQVTFKPDTVFGIN